MIRRKIMNYKHQENGALTGPLIFTAPAYRFVIDFTSIGLAGPTGQLFPPKPLHKRLNRSSPRDSSRWSREVKN